MAPRRRRPDCPVRGCDHGREPSHVMCMRCWNLVPQALRSAVWRTYRTLGPYADESTDARDAAISYAERELGELAAVGVAS